MSRWLACLAAFSTAASVTATPLACQPNAAEPMMPLFHIIGNVTPVGDTFSLEPINDASGITFYQGLYHIWHQCCQNHWDHLISADLAHWQRLPPPIQPLTLKTWDGSITLLPDADGGPVILYDAQDGKLGSHGEDPRGPLDKSIIGVARPAIHDKYLMLWERAPENPVNFTGAPTEFPGQVWKNGDHYNFIGEGNRYSTTDPTLHAWTNMGPFVGARDHSGQWWAPTPNQIDGTPPPAGVPNRVVNVGGGATYMFGDYNASAETFTPWTPNGPSPIVSTLERGKADWFGGQGGADNNDRMMIIGWALPDWNSAGTPQRQTTGALTRLTLLREVNFDVPTQGLVSNPVPELAALRTAVIANETGVALSPEPHVVGGTEGGAAASADVVVTFSGFSDGDVFGACVLSSGNITGIAIAITVNATDATATLKTCNATLSGDADDSETSAGTTFPLLGDSTITLRVLPDRSVADFFLQGGRWAGTTSWLDPKTPRRAEDSSVLLFATNGEGVLADTLAWSMGCGWVDPSYTDAPTM